MKPKILIVDDDPVIRRLLRTVLRSEYDLAESASGEEAIEVAGQFSPEIVLLDIELSGIDGTQVCRCLKIGRDVPQVIMVSSRTSEDQRLQAYQSGADDYVTKPFDPHDLKARVGLHIQLLRSRIQVQAITTAINSRDSQLKRLAEQRTNDIIALQRVAVFSLARVAESRDQENAGHLTRMRGYAQILAEHLSAEGPYRQQIDRLFLEDLYHASPLHDIGKVGIPDVILLKPDRLTAAEYLAMQKHTVIGANILDQAVAESNGGGFLAMAAIVARFHHERFDGHGYPAGLVGQEIPLAARIVALADAYDAITSERPYKQAMSPSCARELIDCDRDRHFDPVVVDAFEATFPDFLKLQQDVERDFPMLQGAMAFREYDHSTFA